MQGERGLLKNIILENAFVNMAKMYFADAVEELFTADNPVFIDLTKSLNSSSKVGGDCDRCY